MCFPSHSQTAILLQLFPKIENSIAHSPAAAALRTFQVIPRVFQSAASTFRAFEQPDRAGRYFDWL
jgi:hypothetical protein